MRQASRFFGLLILMSMLFIFSVAADNRTLNLVSIVLDDFDNSEDNSWIVAGSKFATNGFPKVSFPSAWPEALFGANREGIDYKVLGVWGKFDRQGYNYIEVIPNIRDEDGEFTGLPIPGEVKVLDVWVWGSEFDFYLEAHVIDQRGFTHVLDMGSIRHTGWKNLSIEFPRAISQSRRHVPHAQPLSLMKFVIWTRPWERVDNFYVYFDQIKVLTDMFITRFDGDDLANPENVQKIWGDLIGGN